MPVILQYRIYRSDLELNPDVHYCFGDNDMREGMGGQAKECRGEKNSIGIRTKKTPGVDESAYYSDAEYEANLKKISWDFVKVMDLLEEGKTVVFPTEGFGTGFAELKERAPKTLAAIESIVASFTEDYN